MRQNRYIPSVIGRSFAATGRPQLPGCRVHLADVAILPIVRIEMPRKAGPSRLHAVTDLPQNRCSTIGLITLYNQVFVFECTARTAGRL